MYRSIKKTGALIAAALISLCSCGSSKITVIDNNIDRLPYSEPVVTVHTEAVPDVPEEAAPEDSFAAVALTEGVTAAEPLMIGNAVCPDPAETEMTVAVTPDSDMPLSLNSSMLALSEMPKAKKYTYELQNTNGTLSILGPNLVYVGDTFDFDYTYPGADKDAKVYWMVIGGGGRIDSNGLFTAVRKSVCTVVVNDRDNGIFASLRVHCIESPDDVDFVPLVNNIPIANKSYPLPKDYDPGLDPNTREAFLKMQADAKAAGLYIYPISAYRSYEYQEKIYAGWQRMYGDDADLISARPGYSEHQLGLAIDVNSTEYSFADTPEGKWLKAHCAEYGFIIRYPSESARKYTGYSYEPWHIRYIGKSLAITVTKTGKTLEELLGIDSRYR